MANPGAPELGADIPLCMGHNSKEWKHGFNGSRDLQDRLERLTPGDRNTYIFEAVKELTQILNNTGHSWLLADKNWKLFAFGAHSNEEMNLSVYVPPIYAIVAHGDMTLAQLFESIMKSFNRDGQVRAWLPDTHPPLEEDYGKFVFWLEVTPPVLGKPACVPVRIRGQRMLPHHDTVEFWSPGGTENIPQIRNSHRNQYLGRLVKLLAVLPDAPDQQLTHEDFNPFNRVLPAGACNWFTDPEEVVSSERLHFLYQQRIQLVYFLFDYLMNDPVRFKESFRKSVSEVPSQVQRGIAYGYAIRHSGTTWHNMGAMWTDQNIRDLHNGLCLASSDTLASDARRMGKEGLAKYFEMEPLLAKSHTSQIKLTSNQADYPLTQANRPIFPASASQSQGPKA